MREQTAVYFPAMKNRERYGVQSLYIRQQKLLVKVGVSLIKWKPALRTTA